MTESTISGAGRSPYPRRLQLTMGLQCNVRCTMCYQTDFSAKHNMPSEIYRDRLLHVYPHVRQLKMIGGEPTIMHNCMELATITRAHSNLKLEVITNGVRVDEFWHEAFASQCSLVSFSLNAATQQVYDNIVILGEHASVLRNIERLVAARRDRTPTIRLTSVVLAANFREIGSFIRLGASLGVDAVEFIVDPILSRSRLPPPDEIRAVLSEAREAQSRSTLDVHGLDQVERACGVHAARSRATVCTSGPTARGRCTQPFTNLVVDANGDVRVCCNTWVKLGNVRETPIEELLTCPKITAFQSKMRRDDYLWCSPLCDDNPKPHPLAIAHKTWTRFQEDPYAVLTKGLQKLRQVRGKWVTVKRKSR